ncbi:MAG: hypothetical protein PVH93_07865 [Nitrosopumilaceae archaeon]|jgi:hypothetical protein
MSKSAIFLAIVGVLIGVGIILSFYGNYLLFEELVQGNGEVFEGQDLVIEVELDSSRTQSGIFAIQILDFKEGMVTASIIDPSNITIESESINQEVFEGLFEVRSSGNYKLLIENKGETANVFGVIGPEPDEGKRALSNISMYILVSGLVGMAGVAVYIFINRRKAS